MAYWYWWLFSIAFILMIIDHWIYGNDLTWPDVFGFMFMAAFPVMNVVIVIMATFRILYMLTPKVLLKGKGK